VRFPERAQVPTDIWPFHTGAANEFLGDVGRVIYTADPAGADMNSTLERWRNDLGRQPRQKRPLKYTDLIEFTQAKFWVPNGDFGWEYIARSAEFCKTALQSLSLEGSAIERSRAQNNTGKALLELAKRKPDSTLFHDATDQFRAGLEIVPTDTQSKDWQFLQRNLAEALKCWGEFDNNHDRLREAESLYKMIERMSTGPGDRDLRSEALTAIAEIRSRLTP
jgi:hypothetical protein